MFLSREAREKIANLQPDDLFPAEDDDETILTLGVEISVHDAKTGQHPVIDPREWPEEFEREQA